MKQDVLELRVVGMNCYVWFSFLTEGQKGFTLKPFIV